MPVLSLVSSKGGVGKTTITTLIAASMAADGFKVAVIDADRNETLKSWHDDNYEGAAFECVAEGDHIVIGEVASRLTAEHDLVLIDTAGFANLAAQTAISVSDAVLIVCSPDRGSVRETMRSARNVSSLTARRPIPYRVIRSLWSIRGIAEAAAQSDLEADKLQLADTIIPPLAALKQSTFTGIIPISGRVAEVTGQLVEELMKAKLIPAKPKRKKT